MKKFLITIIFFSCISSQNIAQCPEFIADIKMQKGMFILCNEKDRKDKIYVAQILSVNGQNFSCRFFHSNSVYQFIDVRKANLESLSLLHATVKSNKGGGFEAGRVFDINVLVPDTDPCDLKGATGKTVYNIIATFVSDNKSYLGVLQKNSKGYIIKFQHSKSNYTTDEFYKVLTVAGAGYAVGSKMKIVHARVLQFEINIFYRYLIYYINSLVSCKNI